LQVAKHASQEDDLGDELCKDVEGSLEIGVVLKAFSNEINPNLSFF
jgi:hypothetical protein